jgi:uncharacterized protein (DUF885 family)
MIKSFVAALLIAAAPAAVLAQTPSQPTPVAASAQDAAFQKIMADYEAWDRKWSPQSALQEGDKSAISRMPDVTPAGLKARGAELKSIHSRLRAVSPDNLSPDARFNHAFLSRVVDDEVESFAFGDERIPFTNEGGFFTGGMYAARTLRIETRQEAEAYIARLEATPKYYADNIANMRRGLKEGFTQPRTSVENALRIAKTQASTPADESPLLTPFAKLPSTMPAAEQEALRARLRSVVAEKVQPAQAEIVRFFETEYLPKARASLGVSEVPGGRDYYRHLVRRFTTTAMTPDEVHELGLKEVARIRAEMDEVMKEAKWTGSFPEFLNFLRTDPQFYAKSREELLEKASTIAKRADGQLPALFKTLPRLTYDVRPVPAELEEGYTTGRYFGGNPKLGVAGGYIVNTSHLDQRGLYELTSLTLHEAVPGHHLQIALAQEAGDQPYFRRHSQVTAFTEGWGLYSEFLGYEMGMYRTPYEKFGRLSYEMWRACRLVADTGIHWKGWTIEQARACFRDNSALAPHNIETELQRYIAWPGQALAYKIGELKLKELRFRAEKELGEKFRVREFHDAVLLQGPMPLSLLEQKIDGWIATQKTAPPPGTAD